MRAPIIVRAACLAIAIGVPGCEEKGNTAGAKGDQAPDGPTVQAIEASLVAAERYFNARDLVSAETILIKLIERAPREQRAHELYGGVLYVKGVEARQRGGQADDLFHRASEQYEIAVDVAADLEPLAAAGLHQSAGEIASAAGLNERALEHFREAGRLDPISTKHPLYEAQVHAQLGRLDDADEALQRVLRLDPDEAFAHATLATVAVKRGDKEEALQHIAKARRSDPERLAIRLMESRIRRQCDQVRRAVEALLALDEQLRAEEAVAAEIAECYLALGEPARAASAWEHRYRLHTRHPRAWLAAVRAAEHRLAAGERETARWWYDRARAVAPEADEVKSLGEAF